MKKDESVVLRFNSEDELNKSLSLLHKNTKREILPHTSTGYYVKVSKLSALKIERESSKIKGVSMSKIRTAMIRAGNALCEADMRLQAVERLINFVGFNDNDLPEISSCNGSHEIILVWHGREINENQIVNLTEDKKYIEPSDFIGF